MSYVDAILHVSDLPALISMMPSDQVQDGVVMGFARTPVIMAGATALVYVRLEPAEADQWRGTPGVTILAEVPYDGPSTPDLVYTALEANAASMALYDAVYPRAAIQWLDDDGVTQESLPPFRFGQMS
jgi:hypothetical protein